MRNYVYIYMYKYMHIFLKALTSEMFYTRQTASEGKELTLKLSSEVYSRCKVQLNLTIPDIYTVWWLRKEISAGRAVHIYIC